MDFEMPSGGDLLGAIKDVTSYGLETVNSIYDTKSKMDSMNFARQMQSLQMNTAANIAENQALTARTQSQVALMKAQQPLLEMRGFTTPVSSDKMMLMLAIIGTGIAVFSFLRGK